MPDIGQPSETDKNSPNEIRDGVVSDSTRFRGGFIDQQITESSAPVQILGQFQLGAASFVQVREVVSQAASPQGLTFSPDGTQAYLVDGLDDEINQYSLSTPFSIVSASFTRLFDVTSQTDSPRGIAIKPDGNRLYTVGASNDNIIQYDLSTSFDISTASFTQTLDVNPQATDPRGLSFKPDGSQMYLVGTSSDNIFEFDLSTSFDISTASVANTFDTSAQDAFPQNLDFGPDGVNMYITGTSNVNIYQYRLSTAFDTTTASFVESLDVNSRDTTPQGIAVNPKGSQLFLAGVQGSSIYQYAFGKVVQELQ